MEPLDSETLLRTEILYDLRRMDDSDRVDNSRYQRSWNWGGIIYWAVRERQGQIGWPGEGATS